MREADSKGKNVSIEIRKVYWLAIFFLFFQLPLGATSATQLNPMDGLSVVSLEIVIGSGLEVGKALGPGIFDGCRSRSEFFRKSLSKAIEKSLAKCRIEMFSGPGEDLISVGIFGRKSEIGPPDTKIFFIDLSIWREDESSGGCQHPSSTLSAIGIATEESLESTLVDSVIGLLERDWLCPDRPAR